MTLTQACRQVLDGMAPGEALPLHLFAIRVDHLRGKVTGVRPILAWVLIAAENRLVIPRWRQDTLTHIEKPAK